MTPTAPPLPAREARPPHAAYMRHLDRCTSAERGSWCRDCLDLIRAADAEGWRCLPVGYTPEAWAYELATR